MIRDVYRIHKTIRWLGGHHCGFLARVLNFVMNVLCSCDIRPQTEIGEGTLFMHHGLGVVIGPAARIGRNVIVFQNVTIGHNGRDRGMPVVGDNVYVGAGAKILGPVTVGENSVIGANSVVLEDIPAASLVGGVPAKILKSGITRSEYFIAGQDI